MRSRHSRGATVRLYFDIIDAGVGQISLSPTVALQRTADGRWLQASDGTWQDTIVQNDMEQLSSVNLPGRYYFDFDQELDELAESTQYIVRKTHAGVPAALEYEDLEFGPVAGATAPELCSVQGTIFTGAGQPTRNAMVRATLQPTLKDARGRIIQSAAVLEAYTNETGDFDLPLPRGGIFRLEIPSVGFDRKVTVPDQPVVLFTDL